MASSGPCPATLCPATGLPERSTKLAVVHGSENQLFGGLQNVGWASYPKRTTFEHMSVDHGGGGPVHPIPFRASGSAGGTPIASPLPAGVRILSGQGVGHQHPPPAAPDRAGGVAELEGAAQSHGGRLASPDLLQFQHQPRQHVTTVEARGVLQPLRCRGHAGFRASLPDLHGPLLRKQQPTQLGAIGLV